MTALRAAGAVIIGKTVKTEFACPYPAHTLNPHDLKSTPGISSADMVIFLVNLDVGKTGIIFLILGIYTVLGTFLEGLAMLVLTLPVVFEVITQLGMSPIWFGIVVVIVLEMGLNQPAAMDEQS